LKKSIFGIILIGMTLAIGFAVFASPIASTDQSSLAMNLPMAPSSPKFAHPKIEPELYKAIHPEIDALRLASLAAIGVYRGNDSAGADMQIIVETEAGLSSAIFAYPEVSVIRASIQSLGGDYETSFQNHVQARIPTSSIEALATNPLVRFIRLPLRPTPLYVSEGVAKTGANVWHSLTPYRMSATKPKIAVLDLGFKGYGALLGSELPASVTTRSFRADGDISANQIHGAACAEIVYDMCPNVDLYLVNFSTDVEQHNAVTWLINQGVKVISYSVGWWNAGDGKGTGPIDADVSRAANAGILWASAAGNDALSHWEGTFSDTNGNSYHNFETSNEFLYFTVPAYTSVAAFLNWDAWGTWNASSSSYGGSNQDYDLALYVRFGSTWTYVDESSGYQNGTQWPTESIGYWYTTIPTYWGVVIRRYNTTRNCKLELFTVGNSGAVLYNVPEGSLAIPADSPDAMAVGATDAITDAYHTYSSRGPTHDGRTKPDIAAPSGVSTSTYGLANFYGTSASTPHLAGAFALFLDKTAYISAQIKDILISRAINLGDANKFGAGRLNLLR
jgi:hypothetical protein